VRDNKRYLTCDAEVQAKWLKDVCGDVGSAGQKLPLLLK
jgi:hypothetical protein